MGKQPTEAQTYDKEEHQRQLAKCISFHENILRDMSAWIDPSVKTLEELTIRYLKELMGVIHNDR